MKVVIIGGGAAGFFSAIACKNKFSDASVTILEKTDKLLSKVKVSGGGRCNVTNACESPSEFLKNYPRGSKQLKKTFRQFARMETIEWFVQRGVDLHTESDGRMFPVTNDSQTIIDCLISEVKRLDVEIKKKHAVTKLVSNPNGGFEIELNQRDSIICDRLIIAAGGSPKISAYQWIASLDHRLISPIPSLFTFNISGNSALKNLMGLAVENATVKIQKSKLSYQGPVLITHWGLSGPAVLKLSAWGAQLLYDVDYDFNVVINWTSFANEDSLREEFASGIQSNKKKMIGNANFVGVPNRLWQYLLNLVGIDEKKIWAEINKKEKNRLINVLINDTYPVKGKTTFKEEFVTCGGVNLEEVDFHTMGSRLIPGLYFAGEVMNVDGITGGFNFQAAWSTGFVAGQLN